MAFFVFLTKTNSIAAEYFAKTIRKTNTHRFEIVSSVESIINLKPDFVMLTAYDQLEEYRLAKEWVTQIKKHLPFTKIILGGAAFRSRPAAFFINLKADYALRGEADFTFSLLVDEITKEQPDSNKIKNIPGAMCIQNGRMVMNPEYPYLTRNQLESMDFSHYCYYESDMVSVLTERGCPFGCTFCSRVFGKKIRFLSVDRIISILQEISKNPKIKRVMFANDNMIYNLRRAHKLFGRIIDEKLNERFSFLINGRIDNFTTDAPTYFPHGINLELADLLQKANVEKISFGTESFNDNEIVRLKPEARYRGLDAMRLTRELGTRGITVVHFIIWPSPDALPDEAIESTCKRLCVMASYHDFIENSANFANPVMISLVRGAGLYNRALNQEFKVVEIDDPEEKAVDVSRVEAVETESFKITGTDVYLPFLTPVNRYGTSADAYRNLLILEQEYEALHNKKERSAKEEKRFQVLGKKLRTCRKQVNHITHMMMRINERARQQLKQMLLEIKGVGTFLQDYMKLSTEEKRNRLYTFTEEFNKAAYLGPVDVFEADTRQIFYMYLVSALKETIADLQKSKQVIRKHKKLTQHIVINKMLELRKETPLRIYLNGLDRDIPVNRSSLEILSKHIGRYTATWS
jgi:hypothetical protein